MTPYPAHHVLLVQMPATKRWPARIVASWRGWPAADRSPRPVKRTYTETEPAEAVALAADAFIAWLNDPPGEAPRLVHHIARVTYGPSAAGGWAVLVETRTKRR